MAGVPRAAPAQWATAPVTTDTQCKETGVHKIRIYLCMTVTDPILQAGSSKGGAPQTIEATGTGRWDLTMSLKSPTTLSLNIRSSYANPCIFRAMKTPM